MTARSVCQQIAQKLPNKKAAWVFGRSLFYLTCKKIIIILKQPPQKTRSILVEFSRELFLSPKSSSWHKKESTKKTPPKANMTMGFFEKQPWIMNLQMYLLEWRCISPIINGDFPASHVSFQGSTLLLTSPTTVPLLRPCPAQSLNLAAPAMLHYASEPSPFHQIFGGFFGPKNLSPPQKKTKFAISGFFCWILLEYELHVLIFFDVFSNEKTGSKIPPWDLSVQPWLLAAAAKPEAVHRHHRDPWGFTRRKSEISLPPTEI